MIDIHKVNGRSKTDTIKSLDDHLSGCVKYVSKDYVCYRKEWLYEHLDEEYAILKKSIDVLQAIRGVKNE